MDYNSLPQGTQIQLVKAKSIQPDTTNNSSYIDSRKDSSRLPYIQECMESKQWILLCYSIRCRIWSLRPCYIGTQQDMWCNCFEEYHCKYQVDIQVVHS